ncbi:MAG: DNA repair protein RecO [Paludibacter sp.]|jgi:DNA repair protein RecO (recombination protein O)|nr:DNA repair protein RecO [Paludibacter sp.]
MQIKTRGIILRTIPYSENAVITSIYTEQLGRGTYKIYGTHSRKSKFRSALLQPLQPVIIDVFHTPKNDVHSIKDISIDYFCENFALNPVKNAVALFVAELLFRTLQTQENDQNLFNFLRQSIIILNECESGEGNFHLVFMLHLTRFLGFEPDIRNSEFACFDLMNGHFVNRQPDHQHFLPSELKSPFLQVYNADFSQLQQVKISRKERNALLDSLIEYYKLHFADFKGLKSLDVLRELFA